MPSLVGGVGCSVAHVRLGARLLRTRLDLVPRAGSIKFNITETADGVMGRDVYEYILGQIGPRRDLPGNGITGPVMDAMSMDGRNQCLPAMFTGAKTGIVNPSQEFSTFSRRGLKCILNRIQ